MKSNTQLQIYRGMIQYILDTTNYSLKSIAYLSNNSLKTIRSIYTYGEIPTVFESEMGLVNLFQIILDINLKEKTSPLYIYKEGEYENLQY